MSSRAEVWIRTALSRAGTPPVAAALVTLAGIYVALAEGWARLGEPGAAAALASSFAYWGLAGALVLDAATATARAIPAAVSPGAGGRGARRRAIGALLVRGGYVLAALAFVASTFARDRLELRLAEGEEYTAAPEQFVGRDPARPMSPGPFQATFVVSSVAAGPRSPSSVAEVSLRTPDGRVRTARFLPLWFGWGRFLRPLETGWALRYELATDAGSVLETAFAKLELLPAGTVDGIRALAVPYQVHVRLPAGEPGAAPPARIEAAAYRGRLALGSAVLAPGDALRFEGLSLRFPEARRWVRFSMIRDPGIPLAAIAGLLALAGIVLRMGHRAARGEPSPDRR